MKRSGSAMSDGSFARMNSEAELNLPGSTESSQVVQTFSGQQMYLQSEIQHFQMQVLHYKLQLDSSSKQLTECLGKCNQLKDRFLKEKHEWSLEKVKLNYKGKEVCLLLMKIY